MAHPKSLVHEFLDRKKAGEPFKSALKEAAFQAKGNRYDDDNLEDGKEKFELFKFTPRGLVDDEPVNWWFASTAIPLIAALVSPMANVFSICALVTSWRVDIRDTTTPGAILPELTGVLIHDPHWCYVINLVSLILGFVGNIFTLMNFGNRIRYVIALPMSIMLYLTASCLLIGDLGAMNIHSRPNFPFEIWSGGYWYGLAAACLYIALTVVLICNLIGYVRGHYPQHFELSDDQRTLIVQTMIYFIWLAGGAGAFSAIEGWVFVDGLYWSAVTILTIGYGDIYPQTNLGRALLLPFTFGGILTLGLVVFSIFKSVNEIGEKNIIRQHYEKSRERTLGRTVTTSIELERKEIEIELARERAHAKHAARSSSRSPATMQQKPSIYQLIQQSGSISGPGSLNRSRTGSISSEASGLTRTASFLGVGRKRKRIMLLKEEKERFEAMRHIQLKSDSWKRWLRLLVTFSVFAAFWLLGAAGFYRLEQQSLGMTYWESVYFCWVTVITLGYGDFSPHSWGGRCFYVIWCQFAVPTITILAQDVTSTVVAVFNESANHLSDAFLPRLDKLYILSLKHPRLIHFVPGWLRRKIEEKGTEMRIEGELSGDPSSNGDTSNGKLKEKDDDYASGKETPDIIALANQQAPDATALARQLALAIKRAARDMSGDTPKQYTFEEWVEFTRLIRFSAVGGPAESFKEEEENGVIEWDWLGENSPMMAQESEFVLERLCESLIRYLKWNPPQSSFAENLKNSGEQSLRLQSVTQDEDDDGTGASSTSPALRNIVLKAMSARKGLHPVVEEDHDKIH